MIMLRNDSRHDANFLVTGGTVSGHNDNPRWQDANVLLSFHQYFYRFTIEIFTCE